MNYVEHERFVRIWEDGKHIADVYAKEHARLFCAAEYLLLALKNRCKSSMESGECTKDMCKTCEVDTVCRKAVGGMGCYG